MPKRPKALDGRQLPLRDRLVERLREEQANRGWSDARLSAEISKHYPMSSTTVWKLKNAEPPRGVLFDEADAIAAAFDFDTVYEMLEANGAVGAVLKQLRETSNYLASQDEGFLDTYRDAEETLRDHFEVLLARQPSPLTANDAERIHDALNTLESSVDDAYKALKQYSEALKETIDELRSKLPDAAQSSAAGR